MLAAGGGRPPAHLPARRHAVRALAASADNVAVFFSEDIFVALGAVLLMVSFLTSAGIAMDPLRLSVWAIPAAVVSLVIHGVRLLLFDRRLAAETSEAPHPEAAP